MCPKFNAAIILNLDLHSNAPYPPNIGQDLICFSKIMSQTKLSKSFDLFIWTVTLTFDLLTKNKKNNVFLSKYHSTAKFDEDSKGRYNVVQDKNHSCLHLKWLGVRFLFTKEDLPVTLRIIIKQWYHFIIVFMMKKI